MNFIRASILMFFLVGFTNIALADETAAPAAPVSNAGVMTKDAQQAMTPQQALQRLQDGNQRFVDGKMQNRDLLAQTQQTAAGQYPFAVVLNCLDSRSTPEYIFDQGVGDVFVARVAGNIQNNDILGSMEFATQLMGAKLIVVMGHTKCGAMGGACSQAKLGNLTALLQKIQPAVAQAAKEKGTKDCKDYNFIDQIAKDNVLLVVKQIQENSPVIKKLIQDKKIAIVGAMQDITTGKVTFLDTTPAATKNTSKETTTTM